VRHKLTILLALLAVVLGAPAAATADGGHGHEGDNAAVAINTKDGSTRFDFEYSFRYERGDVVDNENSALAYASCESCRTTAIAVQIVLVVGSPSTVTPRNVAVALNEECTSCLTFATAFQFVTGVASPDVELSDQGEDELHDVLREFKRLRKQTYTHEEFHARTQALADRIRTVLRTQLVEDDEDEDEDDEDDDEDGD
jgi:putative peptide zinc metalloprotease protein